ncbi:GntR family transcriptional regulator [Amycolatopsis sp. NPDC004368]
MAGQNKTRATPARDEPVSASLAVELRAAITSGELVPGQRLVEVDLIERYGASRGAVRNALRELMVDDLVEVLHNKGARVKVVSLRTAIEITEVRMALEALSAAKAAERVTPEHAATLRRIGQDMVSAVEANDVDGYSELNATLHAKIREMADHPTSASVIERLGAQIVRYQFRLSRRRGRPSVSLPQHRLIIAAIVEGDADAAALAMRQHLQSVLDALRSEPEHQR